VETENTGDFEYPANDYRNKIRSGLLIAPTIKFNLKYIQQYSAI